jgi:BirA family biotin operon repressor/biotin-[acetyl-CoA-carboxylase] ligase
LGIKWPNDVFAGGRKIAGLLLESSSGPRPAGDRLVVGIGINVNNSWADAPVEIREVGVSLADLTGRTHSLENLLIRFLQHFETRLAQLARREPRLVEDWQGRCTLRGKSVAVQSPRGLVRGTCLGIAEDGALLLAGQNGTERVFSGTVCLDGQMLPS